MGLAEIVGRSDVDQVVQTVFTATSSVEAQWLYELQRKGISVSHPTRGERTLFADEPEVSLQVRSPATADAQAEGEKGDVNNTSIVLKLVYGKHSILLEGMHR